MRAISGPCVSSIAIARAIGVSSIRIFAQSGGQIAQFICAPTPIFPN